jgi:hypothetical protein
MIDCGQKFMRVVGIPAQAFPFTFSMKFNYFKKIANIQLIKCIFRPSNNK